VDTVSETRLTFLGTGTSQGVPMIGCHCDVCSSDDPRDKRLRSSVHIEHKGLSLIIDAGPDFRQQLLREGIDNLDAILLTHEHKDHTGGLDDVRAFNYFTGKPFPIYCEERVKKALASEYAYAFSDYKYPGVPEYEIITISEDPFRISCGGSTIDVTPIRVYHHTLPVLGFRIGKLAYITDAGRIEREEILKLKDLDILVLNTVRREPHISHFSLREAIAVARETGAKKCYLTHLSHQIGKHSELSAELPDGIEAASDGLKLAL